MAYLERSSRVGRSQGASIFWGLVSVCFAAAACFYYWKNHENEATANQMRDTVLQLKEETETLNSEKERLQAGRTEAESQLKTREDLVEEKENQLAAEETRLDGLGQQSLTQSPQNLAQVTVVRKFNDLIRKLGKDGPPDVVERGGRPVLRIPNQQLFAPGDATLTPDGKALLNQIAVALNGQLDSFELRVVSYTDTDAESDSDSGPRKNSPAQPPAAADPGAKPHYATSWELTAARASAMARFYRDQTSLPFLNVLVVGRGDSEPIAFRAGESQARNRRVEITITPLPVPFHAPEPDRAKTAVAPAPANEPPTPSASPVAAVNKDKTHDKTSDKDKSSRH